jgi:NADP-dependent 3-hydroxy acid dehydrogenase YdfG
VRLGRDQVAAVTGAASGIGSALASAFAERGLAVVMADVESDALDRAAREVERSGSRVLAVPTDVGDPAAVEAFAEAALARFGRVDVVCNNAGVNADPMPAWEYDPLDWEWVLRVNLFGVINGIRAFVPHLVAQGSGHVVNTASMAGLTLVGGIAPYTASKRAVVGISESLLAELDGTGVGVSVLCPSYVPSNLATAARNRPAALVPTGVDVAQRPPADRSAFDALAASTVAAITLDAIERDAFYVLTHESSQVRLEAHQASLRAAWADALAAAGRATTDAPS